MSGCNRSEWSSEKVESTDAISIGNALQFFGEAKMRRKRRRR